MKKLLLVLLVVALASFLLTGCFGVPDDGTEGEGEGDGGAEAVVIEILDAIEAAGKTWVADDSYDLTVTFLVPTENVKAYLSDCTGDYTKDIISILAGEYPIALWPNEDKTVWSGSVDFECENCLPDICQTSSNCCAVQIRVEYGDCDWCETSLPVIVDCEAPWASLELCMDDCDCAGCELSFATALCSYTCDPDEELCGDSHDEDCPGCDDVYDCSGLASWSLAIYPDDPYDECCEVPCEDPLWSDSGTECPISAVTDCLSKFAGVQTGYTTECEENCAVETLTYPADLPTGCTYLYPDTSEDACWWPYCDEFLFCGEDTCGCCTWAVDTEEVCTITCEDTPIYECNWLFVVLTMVDNVGNEAMYGAWIASSDYPDCDNVCIEEVTDHECLDDACGVFVNASYDCDCANVTCTCEFPVEE